MSLIRKELLDILACPKCKTPVVEDGEHLRCTAAACGLRYPVRDGIPVMLVEEALPPGAATCPAAPATSR